MSQADGVLPTQDDVRAQMRTVKPLLEALEAALTVVARQGASTPVSEAYEALAGLSVAHANLDSELVEMERALGLPYERVISASYVELLNDD